jgi:hypothetical protein
MMVSQSLLDHASFALDKYAIPRHEPTWHGYYFKNGPIYQLEIVQGHIYYHFPPGTPILSTPFVGTLNLFGISAVNQDGTYNPRAEVMIEAGLAALLMAVLAAVFFYTARLLLPTSWSTIVALGGALGTQVYSTASRALWSETWGIFLLGIVVFMLLAHETGKWRLKPVLLASLLSWMFFVRPTFAVPVIAISVYLFIFHRGMFMRYALAGAAWLAAFVCYSWFHFGQLLPSYYQASRFGLGSFWTAFAGNLISPARGLLVYVPILLFVVFLLIRYRQHLRYKKLVWLSLSIVAGHLVLIAGFPHWWGGHSFGPRFTTGLAPWFVLLGILGIDAMLKWREAHAAMASLAWRWRIQLIAGGVLLFAGAFINTLGATSHATWLWNQRPLSIDEHPERLWDWRQPQFLAAYLPYPPPEDFPLLSQDRIDFSMPASEKFLWHGWIRGNGGELWAEREAALVFRVTEQKTAGLSLNLSPFLVPGKLDSQRIEVALNGEPLTELVLVEAGPQIYSLTLPGERLLEKNTLSFQMPDAQSSLKMGTGEDPRLRSFNLNWIECP